MPDDHETPVYVPETFQEEHLDEARRMVANSRGVRAAARRLTSMRGDDEASAVTARWLPYLYGAHALAALLALTFAVATTTFAIGAVVVAGIGVSAFVVRSLTVTLVRQHLASDVVAVPDASD